ncbi:MAG: hypothetical protein JSW25_05965 [Thermoplasmata archaeon]|nr:MAG: hypothetical protein JSW25_05965 [Thermoplasmata archaeon]
MAEGNVRPLVLGEGSSKQANVPASSLRGHLGVIGTPRASAAVVADISKWAGHLGAGVLVVDLDGHLSALLTDRADKDQLGDVDLRLLTPSSPVGIPVVFKPMSGLSSAAHTEPWIRLRAWLPQLLATMAEMGPGTPDHDRVAGWFLGLLDHVKESNPSILTVQGMVEAIRQGLSGPDAPLTGEVAEALVAELTDMAEDLRNAALSYGAPVDLRRLLETPVSCTDEGEPSDRGHIDVVLLSHMTQVADRNSTITAVLLEAFEWCRLKGKEGRLLVVVPEVESPATFISKRPFAQRLTSRVLGASKGTGLLAVVLPNDLEDAPGMPRLGAVMMEKARYDTDKAPLEAALMDQGVTAGSWSRMSMLYSDEWALAAGAGFSKWHRFSPPPEALAERQLDEEALGRVMPTRVRDAFRYAPVDEEEACAEDGEAADTSEDQRAAQAVEDAEDLLSYTTERKPKASDSRIHQEVQELLKRKLEEKERAKEASRYELKEIDLVEGEEPSDLEMSAHTPRPLSDGVIDDQRATEGEGSPGVHLHADDLQVELAVMEAKEAEAGREEAAEKGTPDIVVDLDKPDGDWESVSLEVALGAEADKPKERSSDEDEEEEEEIIIEVDDDR